MVILWHGDGLVSRMHTSIEPVEMHGVMAAAHQLQEALIEILTTGDLIHGSSGDHLPFVDHGHMRAHALHHRHHMRRNDHSAPGGDVCGENVADIRA